jgi:pimeloyl-ACP methyl ester carboxylesterase
MNARRLTRVVLTVAALGGVHGPAWGAPANGHDATIRPFSIHVPQETLVDLRRRLGATRWPDDETVPDRSQGVQSSTMKKLVHYWQTEYDWRRAEAKLNALPQFVTTIDGLDIHFFQVKSRHPNALPLIITHGWPGSIIEELKVIDRLTNPTAYGGRAEDAFDVVIPSIPGYGFSARPAETGWNTDRVARAWNTLMTRLGYDRYVAQGGDVGAKVTEGLARLQPQGLLGIHLSLFLNLPAEVTRAIATGDPAPADLSGTELAAFEQRKAQPLAYLSMQVMHPQTIGFSLADSPVGLAAWMIDHDPHTYDQITHAFDGHPDGELTRDEILDNITLYWVTNTGTSAARSYWENARVVYTGEVSVPAAFTVFPDEIWRAPRSWVQRTFRNLVYFHEAERGGHFAAWEQPQLFAEELRAAFRPLR